MMMDFESLMEEATELPNGPAKIELLEQAIRVADAAGDIEQGFEARSELVEVASFSGYPKKALVAFSWQLGQYDKDPELFMDEMYDLLWSYKWILDNITSFPEISMQQIEDLLEDMKRRVKAEGYSDRLYHYYRFTLAVMTGDLDHAEDYLHKAEAEERDDLSDCIACEQNILVQYYRNAGKDEEAIAAAKPMIDGKMRCASVPHATYPMILLPLYRAGRLKEAEDLARKGYRLIRGNRDFVNSAGYLISYLKHTDPIRGLEVFEEFAPLAIDHESPLDRMFFYGPAAALLKRLSQENEKISIRFPASFPYFDAREDVERVAAIYEDEARKLAAQFDERNGNSYHSDYLDGLFS